MTSPAATPAMTRKTGGRPEAGRVSNSKSGTRLEAGVGVTGSKARGTAPASCSPDPAGAWGGVSGLPSRDGVRRRSAPRPRTNGRSGSGGAANASLDGCPDGGSMENPGGNDASTAPKSSPASAPSSGETADFSSVASSRARPSLACRPAPFSVEPASGTGDSVRPSTWYVSCVSAARSKCASAPTMPPEAEGAAGSCPKMSMPRTAGVGPAPWPDERRSRSAASPASTGSPAPPPRGSNWSASRTSGVGSAVNAAPAGPTAAGSATSTAGPGKGSRSPEASPASAGSVTGT